jgi:hypothetical protein
MTKIFDFPALPASKCLFVPMFNTQISRSAFSGFDHVIENPGERWVIQYQFKVLTNAQGKLLKQHLSQLRGSVNQSRLYDTKFKTQAGTWAGVPRVAGANQYGLILETDGWNANQLVAAAMDRCLVGSQLMEINEDCHSDEFGNATLRFTNELREPPSDNETLISDTSALKTIGRWSKPEQIQQLSGEARVYRNITLDFEESFA